MTNLEKKINRLVMIHEELIELAQPLVEVENDEVVTYMNSCAVMVDDVIKRGREDDISAVTSILMTTSTDMIKRYL